MKLNIIDLTNIPLVVGKVYVKWHLPSSSSADHRGKTDRSSIIEHRATFDFTKDLTTRLTIDKNLALQPCELHFEILQEYHDGGRGGRVHLGNVIINLAEYANAAESNVDDEAENGMITRRHLMQDSKVNATLRIGIAMKQIEGDSNFVAPALSSSMIGGIAGIMNTDPGEADTIPNIASKSRELSEAQDIYRRTLAASWACERGELPPDKLIEELFAGGDGGKMNVPRLWRPVAEDWNRPAQDDSSTSSDPDSRRGTSVGLLTPDTARTGHRRGGSSGSGSGNEAASGSHAPILSSVSGRGSIEQQMQHSQPSHHGHHDRHHHRRKGQREYREITEFDLRDDLRSWGTYPKLLPGNPPSV